MMGKKKFTMKGYHTLSLDNLVSSNDLYRKIDEVIDFSFVHDLAKESYSYTGQPSLDPVVFFKIELVGFLEGIHEDRALERRIKDSLAIRWFLGYDLDEPLPVHSTISRTRKDRISKALYQAVFDHILGICIRRQLVKGHHQSIDSTLLKANASLDSLEALQPKVLEHYEKACSTNASVSKDKNPETPFTSKPMRRDPEAKATKKPGFPGAAYYKASTSADEAYGIITHVQVDDANKNDSELLQSVVSHVKQRLRFFGLCFRSLGADKGFHSAENLKFLDQEKLTAYIPPRLPINNTGGFDRSEFRYDHEKDQFICPEGKFLRFRQLDSHWPHVKKYGAREEDCRYCPQKTRCTPSKFRTVRRSIYEGLIQAAIRRCKTHEGREAMRLRQTQAEGTYAHVKEVLKFRKIYSLGLENARKKFLVACSVINLKKLIQVSDRLNHALCRVLSKILACFKDQLHFGQYLMLVYP